MKVPPPMPAALFAESDRATPSIAAATAPLGLGTVTDWSAAEFELATDEDQGLDHRLLQQQLRDDGLTLPH
eukprot:8415202-Pyramimonas_sp.AAC.1